MPSRRAFSISSSDRSILLEGAVGLLARDSGTGCRDSSCGGSCPPCARCRAPDSRVSGMTSSSPMQAGESALDAKDVPTAVDRGEHGRPDDGVETRGVAAAGGDRDAHLCEMMLGLRGVGRATGQRVQTTHRPGSVSAGTQTAARNKLTISPDSACRPSFDFWNIGEPSFETSNRPPEPGRSSTVASGNCCSSSAANLTARGS